MVYDPIIGPEVRWELRCWKVFHAEFTIGPESLESFEFHRSPCTAFVQIYTDFNMEAG